MFVFLGFGELQSLIIENENSFENIHFHPAVRHDRVVELCANADYGLCLIENISLSDFYCLPNKLFEYIFSGTPVLSSEFPEIEKLINEYKIGTTCDVTSLSSIQNAIIEMSKNSYKFSVSELQELSWENQETKLVNCYKSF